MKATRQSLGARVTHAKVGHKILEVGREEGILVCLPLVIRLSANRQSEPLRTSSSISGAKAKSVTLRHPMNNSHAAATPGKQPKAFYTIPTQNPKIGRTTGLKLDAREPAQPMKGTGE
jgi:hypothetical protein